MNRTGIWRTLAFATVYGLAAVAVTAVFWRSNQPSADTVTPLATGSAPSSTVTSDFGGPASATSSSSALPAQLTQSASFSANESYGISGSAAFVNESTVLVSALSFNGTGPKVQLELRDRADETVAVLKELTKTTFSGEDLVLAIPTTVAVDQVSSIAIVAPDFKLVLSRASWK